MVQVERPERFPRYHFAPNTTIVTTSTQTYRPSYQFGHARQFMVMASRALCGGLGDLNLEDRYLRLLCVCGSSSSLDDLEDEKDITTLANFRVGRFQTTLAEEEGANMLLFVRNVWNNPLEVSKQLGLSTSTQSPPLAGNLMMKFTAVSKRNRSKIKKLYQKCPKEWMFETDEDLEDQKSSSEDHSSGRGSGPDIPTSGGFLDS